MTTLNIALETLKNLELLKKEIDKNNKNNISNFKLLKKAIFKAGINIPSDESIILDLSKNLILINSFKILETSEEIQAIYDDSSYGRSCMSLDGAYSARGRKTGEFYNSLGIMLITISGARILVNPFNKKFYKGYGENWYSLRALLIILGFMESSNWLTSIKIPVNSTIKRIRISDTKVEYIDHLRDDDKIYTYNVCGREIVYIKNMKVEVSINYNNNLYLERDREIYNIYYNYEIKKFYIYENNFSYTYEEVFDADIPYLDGQGYIKIKSKKNKFFKCKEHLIDLKYTGEDEDTEEDIENKWLHSLKKIKNKR